jgi:ribonuclease Z
VAHHTSPVQAGEVFNEAKPKLAAYSHIANPYRRNEQELLKQTREVYSGPLVIGEDLMSFSITDTVSISIWKNK